MSALLVGAVAGVLIFVLLGATVLGQFGLRTGASLALTGAIVGAAFSLLVGSAMRK
jgi:uncharacterized membrane protein YeaQ/YmgE (transglycosylase-associated protein family)